MWLGWLGDWRRILWGAWGVGWGSKGACELLWFQPWRMARERTVLKPAAGSVVEVGAGLVFRQGRLLIARRREGDHQGGLWEFPGGKREPGETWEECVRRELREELGMEVEVGSCWEELTHHYPERVIHLAFFLCRWLEREPRPLGCSAVAWVTREELARHEFPAADQRLLGRLVCERDLWNQS